MRIFLCFFTLVSVGSVACKAADPAPSLSTVLERVIERDSATQKALKTMEYHQTLQTERLDDKGRVTQEQETKAIVRPGAPNEIEVLSAKGDNLPSNPDQAALQAQGKEIQKQKFEFPLKEMVKRFNVTWAGQDKINGQAAYVLAFEPKPGQPYNNQTEKVLNQLRGRTWISSQDYSVLKTEATLAAPVEVAWIFAQVSSLTFLYELENTAGSFGPARVQTSVRVDAPFITIRQQMTVDLTQFEPRKN